MQGIKIAGNGGSVRDSRKLTYDTTKDHLKLDIFSKSPKLFDIVTIGAGTNILVTEGAKVTEDVFYITHGLGYKPTVWVYFFVYPNGTPPDEGSYATGGYIFTGDTVDDKLTYEVTETAFRVIHSVENFSFGGSYTSSAANYTVRLKYYIFHNKATNTFVDIGNNNLVLTN